MAGFLIKASNPAKKEHKYPAIEFAEELQICQFFGGLTRYKIVQFMGKNAGNKQKPWPISSSSERVTLRNAALELVQYGFYTISEAIVVRTGHHFLYIGQVLTVK